MDAGNVGWTVGGVRMNRQLRGTLVTFVLLLTIASLSSCVVVRANAPQERHDSAPSSPSEDDPDSFLRAQMMSRWAHPERRTWTIAYRDIDGLENEAAWHIEGTMWWVRINPEPFALDKLDKKAVYELDAVAVDQNYGVIEFYAYGFPKKIQR